MIALAMWLLLATAVVLVKERPSDLDEDWDERQREIFGTCFAAMLLTSPLAFIAWLLTRKIGGGS